MAVNRLKKLQGLRGLSQQARENFKARYKNILDSHHEISAEELYDADQFIKTFGREAFKSYNKKQRDAIYKNYIADKAYEETYSPYTGKIDKLGNPIIDPNKGMGNAEEYEKYSKMSADGKIKLLKSGWKTDPALNFIADRKNDKIIEGIYAEDLKIQEESLQAQIANYYLDTISKLSNTEVESQFLYAITPDDNKLGNRQFAAYFRNEKKEVKDFSIDDMRMYLAKEKVITEHLGSDIAHDLLYFYAKDYIYKHQGAAERTQYIVKDMAIRSIAYTAIKINGLIDFSRRLGSRENKHE